MSASLSDEKLTELESAYVGAIDNAIARRDFATAQKLGADWDKQAARHLAIRERRASLVSLRRLTRRAASARSA